MQEVAGAGQEAWAAGMVVVADEQAIRGALQGGSWEVAVKGLGEGEVREAAAMVEVREVAKVEGEAGAVVRVAVARVVAARVVAEMVHRRPTKQYRPQSHYPQ